MAKQKRSEEVSVDWANGYAAGWKMAVPPCFREALDIRWSPRVKDVLGADGKPVMGEDGKPQREEVSVLTEGVPPLYSFQPGYTLYDTRAAYEGCWGDSLRKIGFGLVVESARPDTWAEDAKADGLVTFQVWRPKRDRSGLARGEEQTVSQAAFVEILRSGKLPRG